MTSWSKNVYFPYEYNHNNYYFGNSNQKKSLTKNDLNNNKNTHGLKKDFGACYFLHVKQTRNYSYDINIIKNILNNWVIGDKT